MDWSRVISIEGVACCATAAICYLIGMISGRDAEDLKSVTRVDKLKDLAQLLNVASGVVPLVVALSGWVGLDTPIECEYSNSQGVIVQKREKHHYLIRNYKSTLVQSEWKEVPWYLDHGTSRVRILGGRWATAFALSYEGGVFEESKQYPDHVKLEKQGVKMIGVEKCENNWCILDSCWSGGCMMGGGGVQGRTLSPCYTSMAFKDRSGAILIRRPAGAPFYVSYDTVDKLIATLDTCSVIYASMSFTVVGVCLLAKPAFEYIRRRRHLQGMWKRLLRAAAKQVKKKKEGSNGKAERELCRICYEPECNSVFVPCGHMCCCLACSSPLILCPVCRAKIEQVVRIFHP